ncbi:MAG: hypothetical protein OXB84_01530 [Halobacteriovoraceae bacterium]|nr:hypothetical protein [Halobacteriovoraceae bacterium]
MIYRESLHRTYLIKNVSDKTGTCFTIDIDKKQYLCTAKHLLEDFKGDYIDIMRNKQWIKLPVSLVGYGSKNSDIIVLASKTQLSPNYLLTTEENIVGLGLDVYFLGFPFGYICSDGKTVNQGFPIPFVKKAIVSAVEVDNACVSLLLDGHNNLGFSGGPVIYTDHSTKKTHVISIISAYRCEYQSVFDQQNEMKMPFQALANSGIIVSYSIQHALDAIANNPIGFKLQ